MARYSKTSYQQVAKVIREVRDKERHYNSEETSIKIALGMAAIFTDDNPRFNTDTFLAACGVDPA